MHHVIALAGFAGTLVVLGALFKGHALFFPRYMSLALFGVLGLTVAASGAGPGGDGPLRYLIDLLKSSVNIIINGGVGFVSVKTFGAKGDGTTNDTTAIQNGINFVKGTSLTLWFPGGTYLVSRPLQLGFGNVSIWAPPGQATIKSTITPSGGGPPINSVFFATNVESATATTLSSNTTKGIATLLVSSAAGFAIGQDIFLGRTGGGGLVAQQFTIVNLVGTNITTDDPVEYTFLVGDALTVTTFPANILIDGLTV